MTLHIRHQEWLEKRGIEAGTALRFGLETVEIQGMNWISVPYVECGKVVNHKYRRTAEKEHRMDKDAVLTLWNHDVMSSPAVAEEGNAVVICEGEWDALALIQCGWEWTVSVPNGASGGDQKLGYLDHCQPALKGVKWFVLATDNDDPGLALREELARRLGPWRCKFITYPDGCKDLNEVLLAYGSGEVIRIINSAKPYPIKGLYDFEDIPDPGPLEPISVGVPGLRDHLYVVPGTLGVFTGLAGAGKTSLSIAIIANLLKSGVGVTLGSFETLPKPVLQTKLRAALMGCSDNDAKNLDTSVVDDLIREKFSLIYQQADAETGMTMEDFLNSAAVTVIRKGARLIWLDPWNELEHRRESGVSETDYIGKALQMCRKFAKDYGVAMWITAHPRAFGAQDRQAFPTLYSISGCYSDDTEVLTKRGWLRHAELSYEDQVACYDPLTSAIVYHYPETIIRKHYTGGMHRFRGYGYDLMVTPDHRMLVKPMWPNPVGTQATRGIGRPEKWEKNKWHFCEAKHLPSAPFNLPLAGQYEGCDTGVTEKMAALAGWYVSEGCVQGAGVSICQGIGEKSDMIESLLQDLGIEYHATVSKPGGKGGKISTNSFYIGTTHNQEVVDWLRRECLNGSAKVKVPNSIMEGPRKVRMAFLEAYLLGDGHARSNRNGYSATTISSVLRDQIQQMSIGLGFSCCWSQKKNVNDRYSLSWQLNIGIRDRSETAVRLYRNLTLEDYHGPVWCLTVPTGAYVTRRNGKATICGNSAHWANKPDYGFTLMRKDDAVTVMVTKVRMGMPGKTGKVNLRFDFRTSEYTEGPSPEREPKPDTKAKRAAKKDEMGPPVEYGSDADFSRTTQAASPAFAFGHTDADLAYDDIDDQW